MHGNKKYSARNFIVTIKGSEDSAYQTFHNPDQLTLQQKRLQTNKDHPISLYMSHFTTQRKMGRFKILCNSIVKFIIHIRQFYYPDKTFLLKFQEKPERIYLNHMKHQL